MIHIVSQVAVPVTTLGCIICDSTGGSTSGSPVACVRRGRRGSFSKASGHAKNPVHCSSASPRTHAVKRFCNILLLPRLPWSANV